MSNTVFTIKDFLNRPISIQGREGTIVVTSPGSCCDHILGPGEGMIIRPGGKLAIRNLSPSARAVVFDRRRGREGREVQLGES